MSKDISDKMGRLIKYGFEWQDEPLEKLLQQYPKCQNAIKWWCNANGEGSRFNIENNKLLKDFVLSNPPNFKISNKCCQYAKKDVAKDAMLDLDADLNIYGVRKAEGKIRSAKYKNCFSECFDKADEYRPLFWYNRSDIDDYVNTFGVTHSACYSEYGLKRTGCAGCPYGRQFEFELSILEKYEPKLYQAVNNIFGDSYEYTRKYRQFVKEMKEKGKNK